MTTESELLSMLNDLKIDKAVADNCMYHYRIGKYEVVKRILTTYRQKLLNQVHLGQDMLYKMDFVIRNL